MRLFRLKSDRVLRFRSFFVLRCIIFRLFDVNIHRVVFFFLVLWVVVLQLLDVFIQLLDVVASITLREDPFFVVLFLFLLIASFPRSYLILLIEHRVFFCFLQLFIFSFVPAHISSVWYVIVFLLLYHILDWRCCLEFWRNLVVNCIVCFRIIFLVNIVLVGLFIIIVD